MVRRFIIAVILVATVASLPTGVLVGKGRRSGASAQASTLALNESAPRLGGTVTFTASAAGLAGWEWPMVALNCFQYGNRVYAELGHPTDAFLLGGSGSDWLTYGGPASCVADLAAYGWQGGQQSIRILASVSFVAAG